jgi:osmotically-inducible protein OsmY
VLDRSTMLSNSRGVDVSSDGPMVVLRGSVKDEDEARLVENMIRLTPGVRDVRNELKFPQP